ncbi:hypothetical protein BHE74_00029540 [Ensete ventricosum]|uniref:Uncharacterized protein n=1 Tax=Ensete ventricosum TaxID=4639 RepID=A0A444CJ87_ENSVE|nr:hypothetical protein B296_00057523 [Ensete ventricosum]RWV85969.1 hypothetical protein GW17_00052182 [Ensete ventricosum]RWW63292.1 hypothetical protein BHE74_00029540 [Ensete ventricosum]RZR84262.1 hypothetical protein BHM03_00011046 [Ensete ventricosum]
MMGTSGGNTGRRVSMAPRIQKATSGALTAKIKDAQPQRRCNGMRAMLIHPSIAWFTAWHTPAGITWKPTSLTRRNHLPMTPRSSSNTSILHPHQLPLPTLATLAACRTMVIKS